MKKITSFCFLVIVSVLGFSQSWKSSTRLAGTENVDVLSLSTDSQDNTIIFGFFEGTLFFPGNPDIISKGGRDYYLAKIDTLSNIVWIKGIGGSLNEFFDGKLSVDQNDDIFITGGFQDYIKYTDSDSVTSAGSHDIFLAKYDTDGNNIWFRNVGTGGGLQRSNALHLDKEGNLLLSGYFADSVKINNDTILYTDNSFKDYFISKFDPSSGDLSWAKSFKSLNSNYSGFIYSIKSTADKYILSGVFSDSIDIGVDTIVGERSTQYDTHILCTDYSGNIEWYRTLKGNDHVYSYNSAIDGSDNIYITGYYNGTLITIDSTESTTTSINQNNGGFDFFVAKYSISGTFQWIRVNGGVSNDRLLRSDIINGEVNVTGYFAGSLYWGGIQLTTEGTADVDMFSGAIDADGNYRSVNSFGGRSNSTEQGYAVLNTPSGLYSIIRSNSDLIVLGDSIYTSSTGKFYIVGGIIGCLPISVDDVIVQDVSTCYGDSTGSLQILASGGFGSPWQYSIDNGLNYQADISYFGDLPAGDYPVVVIDKENLYTAWKSRSGGSTRHLIHRVD